jgi:1,4-alpha-glucan branching enzyme
LLNTDADVYGGSNMGNGGEAATVDVPMHGEAQALFLTLPPLSTVFLSPRA